jgi:dihydropteroate synthase
MNRKIYYWKLRTTELQLGERTLLMGVLNITPDSFSDGGRFLDPDRAYARALEMEEQGVDIIDIGAESTRPESKRITADEEWQRLVPVLKRLRDKLSVPISIDTYKSEIAERALEYGVQIINDPSGLTFDAGLAKVAANGDAGLILNHMRGAPETWGSLPPLPDVTGSVLKDLDATTSRARRAGVEKNRIVVDPGLGFGKRKEQNSEILAQLSRLVELDCPILAAPSRKAFLSHTGDGGETIFATAAAVTAAILNGAHIVRIHDVKEMRAAALMADEIGRLGFVAPVSDDEEEARSAMRSHARGPKPLPAYMGEEKHTPMRPPMIAPQVMRPAVVEKKVPEAVETPVSENPGVEPGETAEPLIAAESGQPAESSAETVTTTPAEGVPTAPLVPAVKPVVLRRAPQTEPSKGWGAPPSRPAYGDGPPRKDFGDRPRPPFGDRPPRKDFGDRPSRPPYGDGPPRKDFGDRPRPPFGDRPPRKDFGDRPSRPPYGDGPPRKDFGDRPRPPFGDRPPRKDFGDRPSRPPFGDGPPRKDFGDRPRPPFGDRPPRKDFGDRPSRPPYGDGPPRKDFGDRPSRPPYGDGPPRKDFGDRPRPPFGDRPPRKDFGDRPSRPPYGDGPPRKDFGDRPRPPFGDRPPRKDFGGERPARPPFGGPPRGGPGGDRPSRPPFGGPPRGGPGGGSGGGRPPQRPFRKRP